MLHRLQHFSIADITQHAEIACVSGKVKFQFADPTETTALNHYLTVDVAIPARPDDTLQAISDGLLDKAIAILEAALMAAQQIEPGPRSHHSDVKAN